MIRIQRFLQIAGLGVLIGLATTHAQASDQEIDWRHTAASGLLGGFAFNAIRSHVCLWACPVAALAGAFSIYKGNKNNKAWQKYLGYGLLGTSALSAYGAYRFGRLSQKYADGYNARLNWVRSLHGDSGNRWQ